MAKKRNVEKNRAYQKIWYAKNKKKQLERNAARIKNLCSWFKDYKSTLKCNRCEEDHQSCMDFHHRDPSDKSFTISEMPRDGYCQDRILEEIAKCEVLCSNCHRKEHWDAVGQRRQG